MACLVLVLVLVSALHVEILNVILCPKSFM